MDTVQDTSGDWLPLREAAAALVVDLAALRKRAQRGTVAAQKRAGAWFVLVDIRPARGEDTVHTMVDSRAAHGQDSGQDSAGAVVVELRARVDAQSATIADLRRRLDQAEERHAHAIYRLQQLLAAAIATQRQLPQETTSPEASTASESEGVDRLGVSSQSANGAPQRKAWWAFWRQAPA